jgi:hypothetical protein
MVELFLPSAGTFADFVSSSAHLTLNAEINARAPALASDESAADGDESSDVIFSSLRTAFALDYVV